MLWAAPCDTKMSSCETGQSMACTCGNKRSHQKLQWIEKELEFTLKSVGHYQSMAWTCNNKSHQKLQWTEREF